MEQQTEIVNKEIHPQAKKQAINHVDKFSTSLILQAKLIAFKNDADVVLRKHIDEALNQIQREAKSSWNREIFVIIGSAFFGAFAQGFVTELSNGNAILIAVYVILGFLGILMVFWALRK